MTIGLIVVEFKMGTKLIIGKYDFLGKAIHAFYDFYVDSFVGDDVGAAVDDVHALGK